MTDYETIKSRQRDVWATGDFGMIAWNTAFAGEVLCEEIDLRAGQRVLDVACGTGNVALSAGRRFCPAVGVDFVPALIERARERAAAERLPVTFEVADAENLPFEAASFDTVISIFGSMFAPDQEKAAAELLRVCRPGGRIGLANWTPDGMWGRLFKLHAQYLPPPPGVRPPPVWGTEARLAELFGDSWRDLRLQKRKALFRAPSAQGWFDFFRTWFGPMITVLNALDDDGRKRFERDIVAVLESVNRVDDGTLVAEAEYLEVVAVRV
jgi:SAM-dependent methyltransferase